MEDGDTYRLLYGAFDHSPDLSPRTGSALALWAQADTVYSAEINAAIKNTV